LDFRICSLPTHCILHGEDWCKKGKTERNTTSKTAIMEKSDSIARIRSPDRLWILKTLEVEMVKGSSVLGVIGGIFAILVAMLGIGLTQSILTIAEPLGGDLLYTLAGICAVGGFLGIVGGVLGKKLGESMAAGSALALIGGSLSFGGFLEVLPFILMLAGGMLALKEKVEVTPKTG
jgi:hypothetical protein